MDASWASHRNILQETLGLWLTTVNVWKMISVVVPLWEMKGKYFKVPRGKAERP